MILLPSDKYRKWENLLSYVKHKNNTYILGCPESSILKENWNAEDLNFSIHLLNYIG